MNYSMPMTGYTKLFGSIVTSTIWRESKETKVLWITMLALANKDGIVEASLPGLADMARLSLDECKTALTCLESPDEYSRTKDHEGRRVAAIDGGWIILNYLKYREKLSGEQKREYMKLKQREHRSSVNNSLTCQTMSNSPYAYASDSDPASIPKEEDSKGETSLGLDVQPSITEHNNEALCQCESVYEAYPRKVAKAYALKCIARAIKQHGYEHVLSKTKEYADARKGENMEFTPYPSTWFNQCRYNDDPVTWSHNGNGNSSNEIWRLTQIRDAKQILMDNLKEGGLVREDKEKYRTLKAEVAELNEKIARQA